MKRILKSDADVQKFNDWASKKGFSRWEEFSGSDEFKRVREHIGVIEQGDVSAYTEQPLNKRLWHIDHFRKRDLYPRLTFDYSNLLVDNRNDNYGACHKDSHKAKVSAADFDGKDCIFNPVEENFADYIRYNTAGELLPAVGLEDSLSRRVERTIEVFNINHPSLVERRADLIQNMTDYMKGGLSVSEISTCLKPQGFHTLIDWWLSNMSVAQ